MAWTLTSQLPVTVTGRIGKDVQSIRDVPEESICVISPKGGVQQAQCNYTVSQKMHQL